MARENGVVLLGCGAVGSQALHYLARKRAFSSITIVDRDGQKAAQLAQSHGGGTASVVEADLLNHSKLLDLMQSAGVVINTVGPFFQYGRLALETALEAGVNYVDVNDDTDSLDELFSDGNIHEAARRSGRAFVLGAGTSPGVTGHMARIGAELLDRVDAIHVFLASTISWRGYSVFSHFTHTLGKPARSFRDGKIIDVPPFGEEEMVSFLGSEEPIICCLAGHPEPVVFPRYFTDVREVTMKLGRMPNSLMEMFRDLYRYGLMSTELVEVKGLKVTPATFSAAFLASDIADDIFGFSRAKSVSARLVRVKGQRRGRPSTVSVYYTSASITGQDAAVIASQLATGRLEVKGLALPESVDPWPIMEELLEEGGSFKAEQDGQVLGTTLDGVRALAQRGAQSAL